MADLPDHPLGSTVNPDSADLPDNVLEHKTWDDSLKRGYEVGERQAFSVFHINLDRLNREYLGMIRWSRLVATGEATTLIVISEMKPVVSGGDTVTINEVRSLS
jgi:defect-in-organelle-trafficking protein DotC